MQKLYAIKDDVLVTDMNFDDHMTSFGLTILSDDGKSEGIKPRWGKVYAVGPEQKDYKIGQWVLVEHGRWSRKMNVSLNGESLKFQKVDLDAILLVRNEAPGDGEINFGN